MFDCLLVETKITTIFTVVLCKRNSVILNNLVQFKKSRKCLLHCRLLNFANTF